MAGPPLTTPLVVAAVDGVTVGAGLALAARRCAAE
jgi:enoyl-CoA hydratase/carnithine racemase